MYKLIIAIGVLFISIDSSAQIQRNPVKLSAGKDSMQMPASDMNAKKNKKEIWKELNLTKEQGVKFKEIRKNSKAAKELVENNDKLTDDEQRMQLKQIRKDADEQIKNILTEEQWQKFLEQRKTKFSQ